MSWKQEVLTFLKGEPLSILQSPERSAEIHDAGAEISLDELLRSCANRPEAAVLIARIPTLSDSELQQCLQNVSEDLRVPNLDWVWYVDGVSAMKPEYTRQVEFKQRAKIQLEVLRHCVLRQGMVGLECVLGCYFMVTPWCDEECVGIALAIAQEMPVTSMEKVIEVIRDDMKTLAKSTKVSSAGYKKINVSQQNGLKPKLGFGESEDSRFKWKTEHIKSISLTSFLISQLDSKGVRDTWWIISPTILNILDDHEAPIKLCGVQLLSQLLDVMDPEFLQLTGLAQIFYDAMKPLLTYLPDLTPTPLSMQIMDVLYPTLITLFTASSKTEQERNSKLIELMTNGIFFSLTTVSDHHEILTILMRQLQGIISTLKSTTIKILPRLVYHLGMVLSDPFIDLHEPLFFETLSCLITTELNCWERLSGHKYDILGMIIMSWKREHKSERVLKKIRAAGVLLENIVGVSADDWDELTRFDEETGKLRVFLETTK